jgi:hypothetical protein
LEELTAKADDKMEKIVTNIDKKCPPGYIINPKTKRCVKECEEGQIRNAEFRCVSNKSRKSNAIKKSRSANKTLSVKQNSQKVIV